METAIEGKQIKIKISQTLKALIPPLRPEEYSLLESNILADGCREPLVLWSDSDIDQSGTLVDGHNRYEICKRHGIDFQVRTIDFKDEDAASLWIIDNQNGRRNISDDQRSALAFMRAEILSRIAKRERATKGGETGGVGRPKANSLEADVASKLKEPKERSRKAAAKEFKVSEHKVRQYAAVAKAEPDLAKKVMDGDLRLTEALREIKRGEHAKKIEHAIANPVLPSESGPYDLILADPPWRYDHQEAENRAIENQYQTASIDEICSHVPNAKQDCILLLWATAPKLMEAFQVMDAWGFTYRTHAIWDKEKQGMGYWFRGQHELLLVGVKGNPSPTPECERVSSVFREARGKHSAKPECVYKWIERAFPTAEKQEMYCRNPRKGWASWGNEV